jgi:hypothetical protein
VPGAADDGDAATGRLEGGGDRLSHERFATTVTRTGWRDRAQFGHRLGQRLERRLAVQA